MLNKKKVFSRYRPLILSRHPSHDPLRAKSKLLPLLPFKSVIRLGSTTAVNDDRIELNSIEAVKNSANKLLMKQKFTEAVVQTARWWRYYNEDIFHNTNQPFNDNIDANAGTLIKDLPYPLVAKSLFGSRGIGNTKLNSQEELQAWMRGKTLSNYIFEKFHNYGHEFRLHISKNGCFYTCRKALKKDIPESEKWHFHDDTCVWFKEDNAEFFRPNSWDDIVADCVKALEAIGADILAFDVKVQSPKDNKGNNREYQNYILLESNSAPSFGSETLNQYIKQIPIILLNKYQKI